MSIGQIPGVGGTSTDPNNQAMQTIQRLMQMYAQMQAQRQAQGQQGPRPGVISPGQPGGAPPSVAPGGPPNVGGTLPMGAGGGGGGQAGPGLPNIGMPPGRQPQPALAQTQYEFATKAGRNAATVDRFVNNVIGVVNKTKQQKSDQTRYAAYMDFMTLSQAMANKDQKMIDFYQNTPEGQKRLKRLEKAFSWSPPGMEAPPPEVQGVQDAVKRLSGGGQGQGQGGQSQPQQSPLPQAGATGQSRGGLIVPQGPPLSPEQQYKDALARQGMQNLQEGPKAVSAYATEAVKGFPPQLQQAMNSVIQAHLAVGDTEGALKVIDNVTEKYSQNVTKGAKPPVVKFSNNGIPTEVTGSLNGQETTMSAFDKNLPSEWKTLVDAGQKAHDKAEDERVDREVRLETTRIQNMELAGNIHDAQQARTAVRKDLERGVSGHSFLKVIENEVTSARSSKDQTGTTSGDRALIEGYMQLMFGVDPKALRGSPQMMDNLLKQGGLSDRVRATVNQAYSGGRLSQDVRDQILEESKRQIKTWDYKATQMGKLSADPKTKKLVEDYEKNVGGGGEGGKAPTEFDNLLMNYIQGGQGGGQQSAPK